MYGSKSLRSVLASGVCAMAIAAATAAHADSRDFNVPAGDLQAALDSYAQQAGVQLLYKVDLVKGVPSKGAHGVLSSDDALAMLLSGTGLEVRHHSSGAVAIVAAGDASDPQSGSAAGDGANGTVQALIVTAQKREEDIQDVPIAISAFTQEDLTRSQVAGGPDLMTQVPNFTFTKTNFTSYSIQIRGIGTQAVSATTDAAVAVAFNNTAFIRNRFFEQEFYDLQRVEVLRGPQGTLYGRNATAGVVNIISAKPTFHYEAKASLDVANYKSHRLEGMVNLPLVDDKVALRVAGAWTKRDGFDVNQLTGQHIDGRDLWSTRVSLRFEPTDNIHANLIWEHFQENDDRLRSGKQLCKREVITQVGGFPVGYYDTFHVGGQLFVWNGPQGTFNQGCEAASLYSPDSFQAPAGISLPFYLPLSGIFLPTALLDPFISTKQSQDLRVIESTLKPEYRAKDDIAELQVSFDLPHNLSLTSETAWQSDRLFSYEDYSRFATAQGAFAPTATRDGVLTPGPNGGIFCDPQLGCSDRLVAADVSTAKSSQFSEELRLASAFDGPFNFSVGANFLRYDTIDKYYVFINTISMWAALSPFGGGAGGLLPPYVPGVTDNADCLRTGLVPPDASVAQPLGDCVYIDPNPINHLNDEGHNYFLSKNPYKLISYALFGESYYQITPNLKLTAGLRWTVDKKEAPRAPSWILAAGTAGYPAAEVVRLKWREPTGRLTLDWKPDLGFTDETLLYASYAHGYKAGGANPPPTGVVCYSCDINGAAPQIVEQSATHPKTFAPEYVDAFEIGSKNTLLEGRLTLNGDAFYYDYRGYQISQIVDRSAVNLNFDAKVWGVELEADWRPLENLRLGLKTGYENTRVADGSQAIDLMDRTAGHSDWIVVRPFPTYPSNCILPVSLWTYTGDLGVVGNSGGGTAGPCELAYVLNLDPVTNLPYVKDPTELGSAFIGFGKWPHDFGGYPGFNPETAPNHGQGFYKDLSGNALPNAPHFTVTVTGDYTVPLPNSWLMTLHTDLYYQSEAWTRIFNTPGYDKLKAYTNVNLAAIFTNEDAGWKIMAYVKNVFDRDSITGAFLNTDDTGLTTNVFLTEPRLYGLRFTKEWTGGPWWTGANPNHPAGEPYPLTVELDGVVQRQDAPYETLAPGFVSDFAPAINPVASQNRDLDWGDGRGLKVTYRPEGASWNVSAGFRYGRTNNGATKTHSSMAAGPSRCIAQETGKYGALGREACDPNYVLVFNGYTFDFYSPSNVSSGTDWADGSAVDREKHTVADFAVGRDFGIGAAEHGHASAALGLRFAHFTSETDVAMNGVPDLQLPDAFGKYPTTLHRDTATFSASRKFSGAGPTLSLDGSKWILGNDQLGHVALDAAVTGGVLFGRQKTAVNGQEQTGVWTGPYTWHAPRPLTDVVTTPVHIARSSSATVPVVQADVGLSYEIQRVKIGAGYHWERYYNVIDGGFDAKKSYDRTIDGPYLKIAVGFGG